MSQILETEEDSADKPEADDARMKDSLDRLRAAADEMDCDILQKVFGEMDEYRVPDDYATIWKSLRDASSNYDYERITELVDDFVQQEGK